MKADAKVWLYDILNAIAEIDTFLLDIHSFNLYSKDVRTKRAVERNLEIIGEAMNRILATESNIKIRDARKIVDLRNRIIHGYDTVSDELVWGIATHNIPILKTEVESLLGES